MDLGPVLSPLPSISPRADVEGKGFGPRALSYIVDVIVSSAASLAVGFLGGAAFGVILYLVAALVGYEPVFAEPSTFINFLLGILVTFACFISFEALCGATPGKLILGMRVATLDGDRPPIFAATVRALWRLIDGLFFGLVAASSMSAPLRQRYGDKRAHTLVVASKAPILRYSFSALRFILAVVIYLFASFIVQTTLLLAYSTYRPIP